MSKTKTLKDIVHIFEPTVVSFQANKNLFIYVIVQRRTTVYGSEQLNSNCYKVLSMLGPRR